MREKMQEDGFEQIFEEYIVPRTGYNTFSKALNRSVTGSMNELAYYAKNRLIDGGLAPNGVSIVLNETIMSYNKNKYPIEAFRSLSCQDNGVINAEKVDNI